MMTVMLIAQLFGYEDFARLLSRLVGTDMTTSTVFAGVVVLSELLALPYLLSMYVSRLFRCVSGLLAFVISGFWLFVALTNAHAANSGIFSVALELPGGLLAAIWSLLLFACVCYVLLADSRFRHATS